MAPFSKALCILKGDCVQADHVCIRWHIALKDVQDALEDLKVRDLLSVEVVQEITGAINRCFHKIFTPGGRIANLIYMAVVYLNPCMYFNHLIFTLLIDLSVYAQSNISKADPPSSTVSLEHSLAGVRNQPLFKALALYLSTLATAEIQHSSRPEWTIWKN
jgi:hypothetical protein